EGFEDALALRRLNALAMIRDGDAHNVFEPLNGDVNGRTSVLGRIFKEIADEAAQKLDVAFDFDWRLAGRYVGDACVERGCLFRRETEKIDGRGGVDGEAGMIQPTRQQDFSDELIDFGQAADYLRMKFRGAAVQP